MFRLALAGALALACVLPSHAQIGPGPGPQPQPPFTGGTLSQPLILTPSNTGAAGLNVAPGVAPTSPHNGDVWVTSGGVFFQIGGVTTGPVTALSGDVTANGPGTAAATVVKINGTALGTTTATAGNLLIGSGTAWLTQTVGGDATLASSGVLTLATVNSNVGTFGSASTIPSFTVNAKGQITAASSITLSASNITTGTLPAAQLPNPTLTTLGGVEAIAAVTHQWINSISNLGVPALSQPAFTDISGSVAATQMPALTGDVTSTAGTVATTISAGAVTGGKIASNTVANSNLANMAAQTHKCNSAAISGSPQDCNLPTFDVKDPAFGAVCNGATTDSTAINNAISAASTAGGGIVIVPAGTCIASNLTLLSNVIVQGQGKGITIIKGPASDTHAIFITQNFATLKGSNTQAGPSLFGLRDMTIDGNKANRTTADNVDLYGFKFELSRLEIINAPAVGLYSEWATSASCLSTTVCMEAVVRDINVASNTSDGVDWNGPHDSMLIDVIPWLNGGKGISFGQTATFSAAGTWVVNLHSFANTGVGVVVQAIPIFGNGVESESNSADGLDVTGTLIASNVQTFSNAGVGTSLSGNPSIVSGLQSFSNTGANGIGVSFTGNSNHVTGINVGSNAQEGILLNSSGNIISGIASVNTGGAITYGASDNGNTVTLTNFQTTGSASSGTANSTDLIFFNTSGGATGSSLYQIPTPAWTAATALSTAWASFTPSPTCGTATITTNSARRLTTGKTTHIQVDFTITALGTCTNSFNFTLPNTANSTAVLHAVNETTNTVMAGCEISSGSSNGVCLNNTGANFAAAPQHFVASGIYENQ